MSTLVHSVKQRRMSKSKILSASATKEGGNDLAQVYHFTEAAAEAKQPVGLWNQLAAALKVENMPWYADLRHI